MTALNCVFMGTPDFAVPCLEAILAAGHHVPAVVTQPDRPRGRGGRLAAPPVKEAALAAGLAVLQPESLREPGFTGKLRELAPDVIVVVAYGQFLPRDLLDLPPLGCINVHASLLPRYRGAAPIHRAVINGETVTGVTTMYMDAGMDTGDMILKDQESVGPNDTTGDLHDRLSVRGAALLIRTLSLAAAGAAPRTPQPAHEATYAPLIRRETEKIDWNAPATAVHNLVRGLNPWPGAYCLHRGRTVKIWRTVLVPEEDGLPSAPSGSWAEHPDYGPVVACGRGFVALAEIQPENRRHMAFADFVRGVQPAAGEKFD